MKEYIERAAVEKFIEDGLNNLDKNKAFGHDAIEIMAEVHYMPAADVVEVTFCKDCRYYQDAKTNPKGFLICPASGMEITETDYCSYGALVDGKKTPSCHDEVYDIPGVEREEDDHD